MMKGCLARTTSPRYTPGMAIPKPTVRFTPAEYYALEEKAEYKSDYYKGDIFAMAGGTDRHSLIAVNLLGELHARLKGRPCAAFDPNLRLKVKATGLRTYPDVSIYCGERERDPEDPSGQTFTNPTIVFEILSPSTEIYDRNVKAPHYRRIESLQAHVFVSQDAPRIEVYSRHPNGTWLFTEIEGLDQAMEIPAIEVSLPMIEIYDRVDFAAEM